MRRALPLIVFVASVGCQQFQRADPMQQYAALQDQFIAAVQSLNDARTGGLIKEDVWQADVLPLVNEGDALLDKIGAAAREGRKAEAGVYIDSLRAVIRKLLIRTPRRTE